ncbi:hypothetical protein GCM10009868_19760 [Terrabacter aerolatus]|uniref:Uncharacterized protein n=1 Tax=Terrabacter aerolatus TaxID=422442 RepID=A0A512D060_9MICO|nr:hypothetical protein TAE01_16580 [Terrabacter aerolatus]
MGDGTGAPVVGVVLRPAGDVVVGVGPGLDTGPGLLVVPGPDDVVVAPPPPCPVVHAEAARTAVTASTTTEGTTA